ncbi:MAG: FtsX-like permease family protein [Bacteroidota bacterium]|nr:FtsX-like permease family protein [Bacteroidota bacterium]
MIAIKLAFRNLIGAGLRTWLNVSVLSFAFVIIVFYNGMLDGWNMQAYNDTKDWEVGNGQLWHSAYDPYDPFCLQDAHAPVTGQVKQLVDAGQLTPLLITQATIYPQGRMKNIFLKGVDPKQRILKLPSALLQQEAGVIPALIGKRMAEMAKLKKGDLVLTRWRDRNGTFDARELKVVDVFNSNVQTIDNNQIWIPLPVLQQLTGMENEATLLVAGDTYTRGSIAQWQFKDSKFLLKDIENIIKTKKGGAMVIYGLLLAIALLAIFDTQVLSIFKRQKEIGTYIALGMTRLQVVKIFTIEGSAHSILAIILGSIYGIPLLWFLHDAGIPMPKAIDSMGVAISTRIVPVYSMELILSSVLLVIISATIVSYFPTRRITRMKPTDALKGKIQ